MIDEHANSEDLDVYALGALDGEEKQRVESHLRACPECRDALANAREISVLLGLAAAPVAPPASVKAGLMQRVHAERKEAVAKARSVPRRERRLLFGLSSVLAFAAVLLAAALVFLERRNAEDRRKIDQLQATLNDAQTHLAASTAKLGEIQAVAAAADTVRVTLAQQPGEPGGEAQVLYNARLATILYSAKITPAAAGKSYQLWLVPASGAPVSAGLVASDSASGTVIVHSQPGLKAKAFAITLEPAGGRPQPTGPKVLVGVVAG